MGLGLGDPLIMGSKIVRSGLSCLQRTCICGVDYGNAWYVYCRYFPSDLHDASNCTVDTAQRKEEGLFVIAFLT
jgi:hypothetical protein